MRFFGARCPLKFSYTGLQGALRKLLMLASKKIQRRGTLRKKMATRIKRTPLAPRHATEFTTDS